MVFLSFVLLNRGAFIVASPVIMRSTGLHKTSSRLAFRPPFFVWTQDMEKKRRGAPAGLEPPKGFSLVIRAKIRVTSGI